MKRTFSVTIEDIELADSFYLDEDVRDRHCPVAQCLKRNGMDMVSVAPGFVDFVDEHRLVRTRIVLPVHVKAKIATYDKLRRMEPFEFELDL